MATTARKELEVTKISEDEAREYAEGIINAVREPQVKFKGKMMKDKPVILVVDDLLRNIELIKNHLVPQGYEIVQATSGEEALKNISLNQVDLVLLDVRMPGMSGFQVLEKLRTNKKTLRIPVMMMTAYNKIEDKVKGLESGCDDFISTPFDKHELLARVKSLIRIKYLNDAVDEARELAENIINTVREPLLSLDQDLRVIAASRSFYEFFKVKPEETVGQLIYDLGNKQWNIPKLRELLETILPQKATFDNYEVEHDFDTIGRRIMLLNARQIQQASGNDRIILLAIEDITERKEIEAGLEKTRKDLAVIKKTADEASEFAESVINTVREPLISLDQDLRVVTVSRSFYEFFKVKPEETVGQLIYDLGNKQWDIPKLRELLETILPQKTTFDNYEVEHVFSTIGRRIMLLNARQIQRKSGKERIILLALEDITERKLAEDLLQKAHNELAAANKELEAFSYSVSHDLRAPLRFVSGFSKIVYENYADKLDTQGKDYLVRIKNGSDRMSQLIEDLLRLSQISRQKIVRTDYDLSSLASAVINNLREADPARSVEVVIAERLRAVVDPNLMKIALANLFNNAWKFTSKNENARIEFGAAEKDAKTLYFVKDNGAGFDPAFAGKMFQPFQRLHAEKEFEGTGIGLSIVERIIRRHEGKVWAEGEVGKGVTIYFTLGQ